MFSIVIYHSLSVMQLILRGKGSVILKAKFDALRELKNMYKKRREVQEIREISLNELSKRFNRGALLDRLKDIKLSG